MRYLIVKGCAGLGNRLLTAASALEYAEKTDRTLFIDWEDGQYGPEGENVFYSHFEIENSFGPKSYSELEIDHDVYPVSIRNSYRRMWNHLFVSGRSNLLRRFPARLLPRGRASMIHGFWHLLQDGGRIDRTSDSDAIRAIFNTNAVPLGGNYAEGIAAKTVFFADYTPSIKLDYLRRIVPNRSLLDRVEALTAKNDLHGNCLGLHIRMSDKKPDDHQGLSDLISLLRSKFGGARIFLATDNSNVERYLKDVFTEKSVLTTDKYLPVLNEGVGLHELNFKSPHLKNHQILEESIIDMWLLSKCEYLFYQGNSAFSGISRRLHQDQTKCFDWQSLR